MSCKGIAVSGRTIAGWFVAVAASASADSGGLELVNLEWRPASQTAVVGETVDIGLYAVQSGDSPVTFFAMEVILAWEPNFLELTGNIDNSPYDWISSAFPGNDFDNLNDGVISSPIDVPNNDGDALYQVLGQFPPRPMPVATQDGLLVTTFRFLALAETLNTGIFIPERAGQFAQTFVVSLHGDTLFTGSLGAASVTIVPEPASLMLLALGSAGWLRSRRFRLAQRRPV